MFLKFQRAMLKLKNSGIAEEIGIPVRSFFIKPEDTTFGGG